MSVLCLNQTNSPPPLNKLYHYYFSGGIGWAAAKKKEFIENPANFTLKDCTIRLEIACYEEAELFTIDETDTESRRLKNNFLSLVIISEVMEPWQHMSLDTYKTTPIFNFFSEHFLKVNF